MELGDTLTWLLAIGLFLFIVREILTWYWKINKIVSLLEDIKENTKQKAHTVSPGSH